MLEVLITVLILAVGLLGVAAMQMMALRNSQQSLQQSLATVYVYSIVDSMRANVDAARGGEYNVSELCAPPTTTVSLAAQDQEFWITGLQAQLGGDACGSVSCDGSGDCVATVSWTARGGASRDEVTTRVQL